MYQSQHSRYGHTTTAASSANPAFTPKDAFPAQTRCRRSFAAQQIKFCCAAKVLRRSKGFDAQQKFCCAAKLDLLRRKKSVSTRSKSFAAPQFCSAGSFAARQVLPAVLLNSFTTMADITSIACLYLLWKRERRRNARRLWVHETIRSLEGWCCLAPNWVLFGVVILAL